jgi:hypothetical protein
MEAAQVFNPEQWHEFFIMIGGATAALTGLVFVAVSINVKSVTSDATHRYRAIGTLAGFTEAFIVSAFGLMGGISHQALGYSWLILATLSAVLYVAGYIKAIVEGGSANARSLYRVVFGTVGYIAEMAGTFMLALGHISGLYIAAVAMVLRFPLLISGAWLLVVRVYEDDARSQKTRN